MAHIRHDAFSAISEIAYQQSHRHDEEAYHLHNRIISQAANVRNWALKRLDQKCPRSDYGYRRGLIRKRLFAGLPWFTLLVSSFRVRLLINALHPKCST